MRSLEVEPHRRYQKVKDLQKEIEAYQGGFATRAEGAGTWKQMQLMIKRHKGVFTALAASILVIIIGTAVFMARVMTSERRATKALQSYESEQMKRRVDRKQSAPKIAALAWELTGNKNYPTARTMAETAIEYDPNLPDGWLLVTALRFWATNYVGAVEAAREYRRLKPEEQEAEFLLTVCTRATKEGLTAVDLPGLSELLTRKGLYSLAVDYTLMSSDTFRKQHDSLKLYQSMIEKAWPGCGTNLQATDKGLMFDVSKKQECVITNLNPLIGIPLTELCLRKQPITDLTPLQGMPLTTLALFKCSTVTNLCPIKGMPLKRLDIRDCQVTDISPLKGMPLTMLWISFCPIRDISPLKGMSIRDLVLPAKVTDLTPLDGMSLTTLAFTPKNITNGIQIVREMKTLIKIGISSDHLLPAAEFWKKYDAGEFNK